MEEIQFRPDHRIYRFPTRWLSEYPGFATWISAMRRAYTNHNWRMEPRIYVSTAQDIKQFIAVVKAEEKQALRAQQEQEAQQQAQALAQQQAQAVAQQQAQPLIPRPPRGLCTRIGGCLFGYRPNNHNDRARTRKARAQRKKTRRVR